MWTYSRGWGSTRNSQPLYFQVPHIWRQTLGTRKSTGEARVESQEPDVNQKRTQSDNKVYSKNWQIQETDGHWTLDNQLPQCVTLSPKPKSSHPSMGHCLLPQQTQHRSKTDIHLTSTVSYGTQSTLQTTGNQDEWWTPKQQQHCWILAGNKHVGCASKDARGSHRRNGCID